MHYYKCFNGPMPTTGSQQFVATGTAIKTMLQIATPTTRQIRVISFGYSCNTNSAGGGVIELIDTDVAATVTAHVASGVQPLVPGMPASLMTLGIAATGYTASAEGAITNTRTHYAKNMIADNAAPSLDFSYQFMPNEQPVIAVSRFLRIRSNTANTVNMTCWIVWDE